MTDGREDPSASTARRPEPRQPAGADGRRRGSDASGYAIALALRLPRDRVSVPVARHLAAYTLREVGADAADVADVELALTEACTNVLDHAGPGDAYDVTITVRSERCEVRIVDLGPGFAHDHLPDSEPAAERGRGLTLMRALMDAVEVESDTGRGTLVTLAKAITFDEASPARTLLAQALRAPHPGQR